MKKRILIVVKLLFLWSCSPTPEHEHLTDFPSKDSLLNLADEVIEYVLSKEFQHQGNIDSLVKELRTNKSLSKEQMQHLAHEIVQHKQEKDNYSEELQEYRTRRITTKDSIIYRMDTVRKKYYITDTIRDTVVITYTKLIDQTNKKTKKNKKND